MESRTVTREVVSLSRGARIGAVVGVLLVLLAVFLLFVPLEKSSTSGQPFRCGTAVSPEGGDFAKAVCAGIATKYRLEAGGVALAAVTVAAGALWTFGDVRRREVREIHDYEEE
ncbi:MAG: hypothetical protein ABI807_11820 [Sporichthyaceae bacterium]